MKTKQTLITMMMCLAFYYSRSQTAQVINSCGNTVVWNGYTVEWSVGEMTLVNHMTASDNSYQFTNGFIQPYPDKPGHPANILAEPATVAVFPNPTEDYVTISMPHVYGGKVELKLYSELGQLVFTDETLVHGFGFLRKINMKGFKNGVYTLYLSTQNSVSGHDESTSKSFKIIKR